MTHWAMPKHISKCPKKSTTPLLREDRVATKKIFLLDTESFFKKIPSTSLYQSYSQHTQISLVHFEYIINGINQT